MKHFLCYVATACWLVPAHAATVNLQVSLSTPVVSVRPGGTAEWFAALSDPIDLGGGLSLLITGSSFDVPCQGCAPPPASDGTYSDLIGAGFVVLAPAGNCCGDPESIPSEPIGTVAVSPSSPFGSLSGFLEIDYALFSDDPNDPNFNPDTQTVNPDVRSFTAVQINVVPEPSTILLLMFAGISVSVGSALNHRR
ncbi:MAG TPA: PEP-CTERM sorting domain-containing protein [Bryobacteraceae bacterium]|nr:PEP-CTERM sorting domain-containing protein [Bryobacteraceae bacterium]